MNSQRIITITPKNMSEKSRYIISTNTDAFFDSLNIRESIKYEMRGSMFPRYKSDYEEDGDDYDRVFEFFKADDWAQEFFEKKTIPNLLQYESGRKVLAGLCEGSASQNLQSFEEEVKDKYFRNTEEIEQNHQELIAEMSRSFWNAYKKFLTTKKGEMSELEAMLHKKAKENKWCLFDNMEMLEKYKWISPKAAAEVIHVNKYGKEGEREIVMLRYLDEFIQFDWCSNRHFLGVLLPLAEKGFNLIDEFFVPYFQNNEQADKAVDEFCNNEVMEAVIDTYPPTFFDHIELFEKLSWFCEENLIPVLKRRYILFFMEPYFSKIKKYEWCTPEFIEDMAKEVFFGQPDRENTIKSSRNNLHSKIWRVLSKEIAQMISEPLKKEAEEHSRWFLQWLYKFISCEWCDEKYIRDMAKNNPSGIDDCIKECKDLYISLPQVIPAQVLLMCLLMNKAKLEFAFSRLKGWGYELDYSPQDLKEKMGFVYKDKSLSSLMKDPSFSSAMVCDEDLRDVISQYHESCQGGGEGNEAVAKKLFDKCENYLFDKETSVTMRYMAEKFGYAHFCAQYLDRYQKLDFISEIDFDTHDFKNEQEFAYFVDYQFVCQKKESLMKVASKNELLEPMALYDIMDLESRRAIFEFYLIREYVDEGIYKDNIKLKKESWQRSINRWLKSKDVENLDKNMLENLVSIGIIARSKTREILVKLIESNKQYFEEVNENTLAEIDFIRKIVARSGEAASYSNIKVYLEIKRSFFQNTFSNELQREIEMYLGIGTNALKIKVAQDKERDISFKILGIDNFRNFLAIENRQQKAEFILSIKHLQKRLIFNNRVDRPEAVPLTDFENTLAGITGLSLEAVREIMKEHEETKELLPELEMTPGVMQVTSIANATTEEEKEQNEKMQDEEKIKPFAKLIENAITRSNDGDDLCTENMFLEKQKKEFINILGHHERIAFEKIEEARQEGMRPSKNAVKRQKCCAQLITIISNEKIIIQSIEDWVCFVGYFMEKFNFLKEDGAFKQLWDQTKVYFRVRDYLKNEEQADEQKTLLKSIRGEAEYYSAQELSFMNEFYSEMLHNTLQPLFERICKIEAGSSESEENTEKEEEPNIFDQLRKTFNDRRKDNEKILEAHIKLFEEIEERQQQGKYLGLMQELAKIDITEVEQQKKILMMIPHIDLVGDYAGYISQSCIRNRGAFLVKNAKFKFTPYLMIDITKLVRDIAKQMEKRVSGSIDKELLQKIIEKIQTDESILVQKFEGSVLYSEVSKKKTNEKDIEEPILLIRGDNPQEKVMKEMEVFDYLQQGDAFAKAKFEAMLEARGYKGKYYIARPNHKTTISNRSETRDAREAYFEGKEPIEPSEIYDFNTYNITNNLYIVAAGVIA